MTQFYLSINKYQLDSNPANVVTATSAPTADFFVQWSSANSPTKKDLLLALDTFAQFIKSNGMQSGSAGTNLPTL